MTNAIYDRARYDLLTGQLNWLTTTMILAAYEGTPVFDPTHDTIAEVNAVNTLVSSSLPINLTTVTPDGTAQSDAVVIPLVPAARTVTCFVMCKNTAPGQPILFIDQANELPFLTNGLDMVVQPDWVLERGWWRP